MQRYPRTESFLTASKRRLLVDIRQPPENLFDDSKSKSASIVALSERHYATLDRLLEIMMEEGLVEKSSFTPLKVETRQVKILKEQYIDERAQVLEQMCQGPIDETQEMKERRHAGILVGLEIGEKISMGMSPNTSREEIRENISSRYATIGRLFFPDECYDVKEITEIVSYPTITLSYDIGDDVHTLLLNIINLY